MSSVIKNLRVTVDEASDGSYVGKIIELGLEAAAASPAAALRELASLMDDDDAAEDPGLNAIADERASEPTIPWPEACKRLDNE